MDQCRGLQRLSGILLSHFVGGQFAQLVIDQRQQLLGGLAVASFDLPEDLGDVNHAGTGCFQRRIGKEITERNGGSHRFRSGRKTGGLPLT